MEFFRWVERTMEKQKVIDFPRAGLEYLENNEPPEDSPYYDFHKELVQFIKKLLPSPNDIKVRQHIIDELCERIKKALADLKPNNMNSRIIVLPCGSSMNGTFLPEADVDLILYFYPLPCNPVQVMDTLIQQLEDIVQVNSFQPIPQAKVPVLRFVVEPGIQIDLSIDELRGPLNVQAVRQIFTKFPSILPAQVFFKCLLHKAKLDHPYVGGINAYTLQLMLVAYIQHHGIPANITEAIIGICNFYGNEFNFTLTGIDVKGNGRFFSRYDEKHMTLESPTTMIIIDPLNRDPFNADSDILYLGLNAFRMNQIRQVLQEAYKNITEGNGKALLSTFEETINTFDEIRQRIDTFSEHLPKEQ
ncbi:PAP/25A associated domain containing protein [Tritrichomonas foetus]|uniref:PAP/25A associated domain containing protein n=1 Tax=Tritrichomonas foetus TaxID=1144522 RepID=A0A1J4KK62_9EUKA|nr:PAP/25A associated domain containing protein [Tritrichomonas foetus]|eukprot:OHT11514.1 PAP/25A associated domain containing protein [Tritrichomonas foetus]